MSARSAAPVLLLATLALGCVRTMEARARNWWAVRSEHVSLRSDVPSRRAVDYALRLEILHQALARVFPGCSREDEITTEVVALRHDGDYESIGPSGSGGVFLAERADLTVRPTRMIVAIGRRDDAQITTIFLHELTHRFVAACYPDAPTWLHEGLAGYFETLRLGDDIVVGTPAYLLRDVSGVQAVDVRGRIVVYVPRRQVPRPSEIMGMPPSRFYHGMGSSDGAAVRAYAGAWAVVHLLMLGPYPELRAAGRAYLERIELGREDAVRALAATLDTRTLDAAIAPYFEGSDLLVRRVPYDWPPIPEPVAVRMQPAEAHLFWADLHASTRAQEGIDRARAHLEVAARYPVTRARAQLFLASIAPAGEVRPALERALELGPDDRDVIRAWALYVLKHDGRAGRIAAAARLSSRSDLRAVDRIVLADLALSLGDPAAAIEHGRGAVALDPALAEAHFALARSLVAGAQPDAADRELELAAHLAGWRRPDLARRAEELRSALRRDGASR